MTELVRISQDKDRVSFSFNSCFPTEITIKPTEEELLRLGKLLLRLGTKRRTFTWSSRVTTSHGDFIFKITGRKGPSLTFEYQIHNEALDITSDCEGYYDTASYDGVLQLGEELMDPEKTTAVLYEYNE